MAEVKARVVEAFAQVFGMKPRLWRKDEAQV
jgi:hypothetical protein